MQNIQVEHFNPSQRLSFDITVYDQLARSKNVNVFKIHKDYELTMLLNCSGKRIVGNNIHNFYEEDMFLLGPNLPHSLILDKPGVGNAICIHFTESSFGKDFFNIPQNFSILNLLSRVTLGCQFYGPEVEVIKAKIKNIKNLDPFYQMMSFLDILYALSNVKDYLVLCSPGYKPTSKRKETKRMSLVNDYILENFDKKLTLKELSDLISVSPATFCRLFKKSMNKNFTEFIAEVRIGHACKLLLESDLSISEICYLSGYNHLTLFGQKFKQYTGKTPKAYRKGFH